jgi:hypothetical protein
MSLIHPNYIADENKFKLAQPPGWWLRKLYEFDSSLVVIPSRQSHCYRLAQRRELKLPEHMVNDALFKHSDTQMMASYGLVPVTTIMAWPNWDNPYMWKELAERAPWRQGGADMVNKLIEDHEREEQLRIDLQNSQMTHELAHDSWKLYRKKIGLGKSTFSQDKGTTPKVS